MAATNNYSPESRARNSLARHLARRDHSRGELREKLSKRFEPDVVEKVLDEAEARGWLASEQVIAERLIAALRRKFKSRRYIEAQLRRRGLPWVDDGDSQGVEVDNARALVEKKFGPPRELSREDRERAYRFLRYRGFEDRWIRQVFYEER